MTSAQEDSMTSPKRSLTGGLLLTSILLLLFFTPTDSFAIPVFARKYGLPCSACHEAWPKLNSFGQKFKDEGYQLGTRRILPSGCGLSFGRWQCESRRTGILRAPGALPWIPLQAVNRLSILLGLILQASTFSPAVPWPTTSPSFLYPRLMSAPAP